MSSLSRGSITPVSVPNTSSPANSSLPAYTKPQSWIRYVSAFKLLDEMSYRLNNNIKILFTFTKIAATQLLSYLRQQLHPFRGQLLHQYHLAYTHFHHRCLRRLYHHLYPVQARILRCLRFLHRRPIRIRFPRNLYFKQVSL